MGVDKPDRADDAKKGHATVPEWVPDMKISIDREFENCEYSTAISIAGIYFLISRLFNRSHNFHLIFKDMAVIIISSS